MEHPLLNFFLKVGGLCVMILAPIKAVILTVGFLIFADLITGVWAAIKRRERITSAALRRTLSKFVVYQLAILSGFLIERFLVGHELPIVKIVAGYIGIVEFKSILENGETIIQKKIFRFLIKTLGSRNEK